MPIELWKRSTYKGYESIVGENDCIRVEIVPGRGSKVVSFVNRKTGREWAYQNNAPWLPLHYGMTFEDGDRSGWDEMFPTILACPCPDEPWQHSRYPDHGEVWTLAWNYELREDAVQLWVYGVQVPYRLVKTYRLAGSDLKIEYELHNLTPFSISYMWCAHNLLQIEPGMQWIVEPNLDSVIYQYSHQNRMTPQKYGRTSFPAVHSPSVDLSIIEANQGRVAEKYWFEGEIKDGTYGIWQPATGEQLLYAYNADDIPYLAIWANYGVFNDDYTAALEPATGYLDDLYAAHLLQKVKTVQGNGKITWNFIVRAII